MSDDNKEGAGVPETWQHVANEWADMATSAIQAVRNIIDGITKPEDVLANLNFCYSHCAEVQSRASAAPPADALPGMWEPADLTGGATDHPAVMPAAPSDAVTLILLSTGSYSDYSVMGAFRPCKAFNVGEALEAFKAQWKPDRNSYSANPGAHDFAAWLSKEGYVEDAPTEEVHLGCDSDVELSNETKARTFAVPGAAAEQTKPGALTSVFIDAIVFGSMSARLYPNQPASEWIKERDAMAVEFDVRARAALSQTMQAEPAAGEQAGAVAKMMPKGFLSDVMTAAGLVEHGRQCKALSNRLVAGINAIHDAALDAPGAAIAAREQEAEVPPPSAAERGLTYAERRMLSFLFSQMSDLSDAEWRQHDFRRATFDRLQSKCLAVMGYASREEAPATPQGETLTDEQIIRLAYQHLSTWDQDTIRFSRAVLALKGMQPGERKDQE